MVLTAYDNAPFATPNVGDADPRWIRMRVRFDDSEHRGTGATNTFRKRGNVIADLYAPMATGDEGVLQLADAIKASFRQSSAKSVLYGRDPSGRSGVQASAPTREGNWWTMTVTIPFISDTTAAAATNGSADAAVGYEAAADAIRSRFNTLIATPAGVPTIYDNDPTAPPATRSLYVRFSVLFGGSGLSALGSNGYRTVGAAYAMILAPLRTGDRDTLDLVDLIDVNFRAVSFAGVTFRVPTVRVVGESEGMWQTSVVCPFVYDEVLV